MTDTVALRAKIAEKGYKIKFIAEKLGLSSYGFTKKLENKSGFKTEEITILCELLGITTLTEKENIFFKRG